MSATSVRRIAIDGPHSLWVDEVALRELPEPGWARLRSRAIGICGSDLHALAGHLPFVRYPVFPGHELVAEVEAVGDGVDPSWTGQRVVLEPGLSCGHCRSCSRGDVHLCESLRVMGFQAPGGMADAFDAPADRLHLLPERMATEQGALVEPLAVATHAVRLAGTMHDRDVLVLGAGTIGVVLALVARADGARVLVVDPDDERRHGASSHFGLDVAPAAPVDAFDVAFECVGLDVALRIAVGAVRKGGTVLLVGVHGHDASLQLRLVLDRELCLKGTSMYQREDVERAIALLHDGTVDLSPMIGARFALAEAAQAFDHAAGGGAALKVILVP